MKKKEPSIFEIFDLMTKVTVKEMYDKADNDERNITIKGNKNNIDINENSNNIKENK